MTHYSPLPLALLLSALIGTLTAFVAWTWDFGVVGIFLSYYLSGTVTLISTLCLAADWTD